MKKILYLLTSCFLLASCEQGTGGSSSSRSNLTQKEIVHVSTIDLAVDEIYNIFTMANDEFKNEILSIEMEENDYLIAESDIGILKGKAVGTTTLKIVCGNYYQNVEVKVNTEEYVQAHFKMDKGRLWGKKVLFFGDSITATGDRPDRSEYKTGFGYYPDLIEEWAQVSAAKNYAASGAITGNLKYLSNMGFQKIGVVQVRDAITQNQVKDADYAFIFLGTNDCMYAYPFGDIDDVPVNSLDCKTYMGSYNYMVSQLKKENPNIRLVGIELAYTTWGQRLDVRDDLEAEYGLDRPEYTEKIRMIAAKWGFITIPTWDLWDSSNWPDYIPDGIHPAELGHITLAKRILSEL